MPTFYLFLIFISLKLPRIDRIIYTVLPFLPFFSAMADTLRKIVCFSSNITFDLLSYIQRSLETSNLGFRCLFIVITYYMCAYPDFVDNPFSKLLCLPYTSLRTQPNYWLLWSSCDYLAWTVKWGELFLNKYSF